MRTVAWISAIALGLTAGTGWAAQSQDADKGSELPAFKKADANGDGHLTFSEAKKLGIKKKTFKAEDLDKDGKLSKYDYKYGVK